MNVSKTVIPFSSNIIDSNPIKKSNKTWISRIFSIFTKTKDEIIEQESYLSSNILEILKRCLNNNKDNIDTAYLDDYFDENKCPDFDIKNCYEKYINSYFLLIQSIIDELSSNPQIINRYGYEILKHLEDIKDKKELKIYQITVILEFIFKNDTKKYAHLTETDLVERALWISNNYYLDKITNKNTWS